MSMMRMRVVLRPDVFHLQHIAAFGTALDGAVAGHLLVIILEDEGLLMGRERRGERYGEPDRDVRVGRVAGAAGVLFVAEGFHDDGVVKRACEDPRGGGEVLVVGFGYGWSVQDTRMGG